MTGAVQANDVQGLSGGRFTLGLGSQIKPHITRRYSMEWSHPAPRMREFVLAVRAIWEAWATGSKLDFRGDFYTHRNRQGAGQTFDEFDPGHGRPLIANVHRLGERIVAQQLLEARLVELARRAVERRVVHNGAHHNLVRDVEAEGPGALVENRLGHETRQNALVDSERAGLLGAEIGPVLPAEALQLAVIGGPELLDRNLRAADLRHDGRGRGPENVSDAPDGEAANENAEQQSGNDLADRAVSGLSQPVEHR